jgi:4,5-DOPA dioxygenase extradiol
MPALFVGHGNPMNAILDTTYGRAWRAIGARLPAPRAILAVSAHWYLPGTFVTAMARPRTIHDFGRFPPELFAVEYPAPGDPALARRIRGLVGPEVGLDTGDWGLDHGTWSVLVHLFPEANVPVVQLSIDDTLPPAAHLELGRRLAPLRHEGVLVLGSGNVVHNLESYAWGADDSAPADWALRFEAEVRRAVVNGDDAALAHYERLGRDALLAVPTPEHYLPLLYVLGARAPGDVVGFPVEGIEGGSISMLAVELHSGPDENV